MVRTRILLGSALTLSLLALVSFASKPRPTPAPKGTVITVKDGPLSLELKPSHTAVHGDGTELFAELTVGLESTVGTPSLPIALALVLDCSGSMSGAKLEDARKAAHRLVDLLGEGDELALISFGTELKTVERRRIDAESRALFHAAIDQLQAAGSTYLSGGLQAGWTALQGASGGKRLVLVSDGQPTVGLVTHHELASLVGRVHDDGITVTALGVGADIDGPLMTHLAERGGGMYGYLQNASALEELLGREVDNARRAVARNVELELDTSDFASVEVPGRHPDQLHGRLVLHLADLRPGLPTRVLVRLQSRPGESGELRQLAASVRARFSGQALAGLAQLPLVVLDDAERVGATREESVFTRGVNAAGSARLLLAAAAFERGDESGARSLLDNAKSIFGMSADALAGTAEVESVRTSFGQANGYSRKELARGLEKKKLSDFGKENEGY